MRDFVKLQSQVQTSVLGLGVDFVLPLSQQQEQEEEEEEPPPKFNWSLTLKAKSCFVFWRLLLSLFCCGEVAVINN